MEYLPFLVVSFCVTVIALAIYRIAISRLWRRTTTITLSQNNIKPRDKITIINGKGIGETYEVKSATSTTITIDKEYKP